MKDDLVLNDFYIENITFFNNNFGMVFCFHYKLKIDETILNISNKNMDSLYGRSMIFRDIRFYSNKAKSI